MKVQYLVDHFLFVLTIGSSAQSAMESVCCLCIHEDNNIMIKQGRALGCELVNSLMLGQITENFNFSLEFFTQSNEKTKPSEELMQLSSLKLHYN